MEQKIYNILIDMQKDIKDLKGGQSRLEKRQENLENNQKSFEQNQNSLIEDVRDIREDQRIMKNNIAQILEKQIELNRRFEKHEKEANIRYKELDYRVTVLEA